MLFGLIRNKNIYMNRKIILLGFCVLTTFFACRQNQNGSEDNTTLTLNPEAGTTIASGKKYCN